MATIGTGAPTLLDVAKRLDPDGRVSKVAELLSQYNPILDDAVWKEGNQATGSRITVRTSLPTVNWRQINQGVSPSKSTSAQYDETCGMLEAYSEIDKDLCELNGNTAEFRLSEATAFIEALSQEMSQTLFYGNSGTAPEEFTGLATRYNLTTGTNGQNIINVGTVTGGDGSSIWLVGWGGNTVNLIYPKGSKAGIFHEDLGLVTVETTAGIAGNRMRAYQDHWQWKCGLAVQDWRYAVRIANIDVSALVADPGGSTVKLFEYLSRAIDRLPSMSGIRPVFYMSRTVASILRVQAANKSIAAVEIQSGLNQFGRVGSMAFQGIPIRVCDQILETEAQIS